jgi:hypothetical protein
MPLKVDIRKIDDLALLDLEAGCGFRKDLSTFRCALYWTRGVVF